MASLPSLSTSPSQSPSQPPSPSPPPSPVPSPSTVPPPSSAPTPTSPPPATVPPPSSAPTPTSPPPANVTTPLPTPFATPPNPPDSSPLTPSLSRPRTSSPPPPPPRNPASPPPRSDNSSPPPRPPPPAPRALLPPHTSPHIPQPYPHTPPHTPPHVPRASPPPHVPQASPPPPPHTPPQVPQPSLPPSPLLRASLSPTLPPDISVLPPRNSNYSYASPNIPSGNGGIGTGGIVEIGVVGVVVLTLIVLFSCCFIKRKKKNAKHNGLYDMPTSMGNSPRSDSGLLKIQPTLKFTYEDLVEATNGFSPLNLLGSGGFGFVYKGYLADGTEVAVKELKIGGGQGEREFSAEVEIISRIHHRHLVSLVGYCVSENKRLLVYEYVPNNTLHFHLQVSELVLDWPTRVKVASGAARGIAYLHEDCHPRIIHRDIKSSNILLDKNFEARVSDFGLAKLAADMYTHVTTRVMGTFGYMAPEYATSGMLTEKSDVFSYGVVLLELITGRKSVDVSQPLGDESLVEWARPLLSHALETGDFRVLVDPRLGMNFVASEMFRMIEAAAACVRHSATKRPRMGQIVRAFENLETEDLSNGMKVGQSEIYESSQQSAEISLFRRMEFGSQNYSTDYFTQGSATPYSNER